jgi:hypothetical protein
MEWAAGDVTEAGVFPSVLYGDIVGDAPEKELVRFLGFKVEVVLGKGMWFSPGSWHKRGTE